MPNAPTPPAFNSSVAIFPSDLLQVNNPQGGPSGIQTSNFTTAPGNFSNSSGGFYTQISVTAAGNILTGVTASGGVIGGGSGGFANPMSGTSIYLPLPHSIQDEVLSIWNDLSVLDYIPIMNQVRNLVNIGLRGGGTAQTVNPFLFMLYKQPVFRVFDFKWILAPNNEKESTTLMHIINYLKTASLPDYDASMGNLLLDYPYIALPRLNPNQFLFDIKPCAIEAVQADYTGSGMGPSFFRDGAPTMVALTIRLKEVDILTRTDMVLSQRGGVLTNGMAGISGGGGGGGAATTTGGGSSTLQGTLQGLGG